MRRRARAAAERRRAAAERRKEVATARARTRAAGQLDSAADEASTAFASLGAVPNPRGEGSSGTQGPLLIGLVALGTLGLVVVGVLFTSRWRGSLVARWRGDAWAAPRVRWSPDRSTSTGDRALVAVGALAAICGGFVAAYYVTTLL